MKKLSASLLLIMYLAASSAIADTPNDRSAISKAIKTDVAQIVAGLNAHDAGKTTALDSSNIISMECGSPPTVGAKADKEGFAEGFAHDPNWKVALIEETVDVASAGDMAVYRGIYNEDNTVGGVLTTHRTNFIAEFRRNGGAWKMDWYIVANMEKPHPRKM